MQRLAQIIVAVALAGWVLLQVWYAFAGFALMPHRGGDGRCYQSTEYAFGFLVSTEPVADEHCGGR